MSSDEGVLVCQSCNKSAARLRVAVVAPQAIVGAVRAVPPQKGPVLLLFRLIIIMGRVGALPEVDACGSVESALSRGGADQSYAIAQTLRRWRVPLPAAAARINTDAGSAPSSLGSPTFPNSATRLEP